MPDDDLLVNSNEQGLIRKILDMAPKSESTKNTIVFLVLWLLSLYITWGKAQASMQTEVRHEMEAMIQTSIKNEDSRTQLEIQSLTERVAALEADVHEMVFNQRNQQMGSNSSPGDPPGDPPVKKNVYMDPPMYNRGRKKGS